MSGTKDQDCKVNGEHILVMQPRRTDGIGQALRFAYRGRLNQTPPDMRALLEKLR